MTAKPHMFVEMRNTGSGWAAGQRPNLLRTRGPGGAVWRGRGVVLFVSRDAGLQRRGGRPKLVSGQRQRRPRRRSARSTKLSELSAGMTRASPTLLSGPSSSSSLIPCRPTRAVHRRPTLSVAIRLSVAVHRQPSPSLVCSVAPPLPPVSSCVSLRTFRYVPDIFA